MQVKNINNYIFIINSIINQNKKRMKKILSLLTLMMLCIVGANAEKVIYAWPGGDQANLITLAEGVTLQITGNESKKIQGANSVTVNGTQYTTMKVSNGAQNTLTLPKKATGITFYSYINKASDAEGLRDSYWKEVAGVTYDAETSGGLMGCYSDGDKTNPDVRSYTFDATDVITFTNAGEQVCYVMEVEYADVATTKTIGLIPGVWDVDGATFAAYAWNDKGNTWIPFVKVGDAYGTQIPDNFTGIVLTRINPDGTDPDPWKNVWNQTDDIDFTKVADQSIITITGWNTSDFTISAPVDLATAKAQLEAAIEKAKALNAYANDDTLAAVIKDAMDALTGDDAATIVAAAKALESAAIAAAKEVLTKAVELSNTFGFDASAAQAVLDKENPSAEDLQDALNSLLTNAIPEAKKALAQAKSFFNTFDKTAAADLAEDFANAEAALNGTDLNAMINAAKVLLFDATPAAKAAMLKVFKYVNLIDDPTLIADAAVIKDAMDANNLKAMMEGADQLKADFPTAVDGYITRVEAMAQAGEEAGKKGVDKLKAALETAKTAIATAKENDDIVAMGDAVHTLVQAVEAYKKANTFYTVAGTKDLTGTEEAWQIVEANYMTLDIETGLYTWTAENITVTAENQPQFKVVITDIDGNQTWVPASEEDNDHNWIITPDYLGGEGVYTITITFNAKTQEIGVTGVKAVEPVEGIIPDGTYYVMSANEGTLINAEGALDAKGTPITFTFDAATNTYAITGADFFTGKQWTIADAVEGMSGYYTISTPEGFLAANATALEQIADGTADAAVWILLEKAYWEDIVNSTYTIAGTKNLTGTENDWDIVETNQMTFNDKTGLYEKKFKKIAIDGDNQPEFKVVQTNMEGVNTWYPTDGNWVITTDYVGGEGLYNITITFDPSDFKEINVIPEECITFPENAIVYDFEAAAEAGENPANKNGSAGNGQAFYGWENPEKTDSKRQDYKGYEWAEGSVLPEECHVWRRSDRINGNVAGNGGLKCPSNKEMAIDGLNPGDKVIIVYDAENATDKEIIWAIGDGTSEGGPGTVRATATIAGVEAVTGETTIASGAEIVINSVTPAENGTGYIVFQVKKGMIIQQIAVIPAPEEVASPYYLVGTMTNWADEGVKEDYNLTLNTEAGEGVEEYMITLNLTTTDQFKIVKKDGETLTWYPSEGNNYGENGEITEDGEYTVYFRPNGDGGADWFHGVIYVASTTTDGISFVNIDTQDAVVYNMKGQRVTKAQKGLFIVNGKKMVIR